MPCKNNMWDIGTFSNDRFSAGLKENMKTLCYILRETKYQNSRLTEQQNIQNHARIKWKPYNNSFLWTGKQFGSRRGTVTWTSWLGFTLFLQDFSFKCWLLRVCCSTTATSSYYILTCSVSHFVMDTGPFTSEKRLMSVRICEKDEVAKRLAK